MSNLLSATNLNVTPEIRASRIYSVAERVAMWSFLKVLTLCLFFLLLFIIKSYLDNPQLFNMC